LWPAAYLGHRCHHQSEFWKELDISSRKDSRIVDSLLDKVMCKSGNCDNRLIIKPECFDIKLNRVKVTHIQTLLLVTHDNQPTVLKVLSDVLSPITGYK